MKGQLTVEPCGFCGEPSVTEVVVAPKDSSGARPLKSWVCATHRDAVEMGVGWQGRERGRLAGARADLQRATDEARLFDPGSSRPRYE